MKTSESIGKLAEALAKVQAEMPPIPKNGKNPFLKNEYVLLDDIVTAANKLLPVHGLAVLQMPVTIQGEIGVTTRLAHSSGEWIESTVTLPMSDEKGKSSAQVAGSVITYLRRYSLGALLGIASESDDDGNGKAPPKQTTQPEPAPAKNGKPQADSTEAAETKQTEYKAEGPPPQKRMNGASKSGNPLQVWVDEGIAENLHNAAEIATLLGGTNIDEARRYRRWRQETDASPKVAAEHAKAGNEPS